MPSRSDVREPAEARVVRQLVEALLFERLVAAEASRLGGEDEFRWSGRGRAFRCRARRRPFGRLQVDPSSVEARADDGAWRTASLADLVGGVTATAERGAGLLEELERTVALCRWNEANAPRRERRGLEFRELDGAIDEGHPYHPSFKARTGFTDRDHAAFGPEAGRGFQPLWLAVRRDLVASELPVEEDAFWRAELGEQTFADLDARRAALGARDHALIPIHPWQWGALEGAALAPLISAGAVHALGHAGPLYAASQSVRTLHNLDDPLAASVKLAMNMSNSSSLRTIEPHSVCVAPALSRWLAGLVEGDDALRGRVSILQEYAGLVVDRDGPLGGQVAAIWRESAQSCLAAGEAAAPFNALMATEADGRLFVEPWLRRYGAEAWIARLVEVAVAPVWRLLVRHGVALEAHGQNMLLVHRDGWPERIALRDFHDSLEYVPEFLRDPTAIPDLAGIDPVYRDAAPNRFHRMDSVEELRALVMDSQFVFCLSDLAEALERAGGPSEDAFWRLVAGRVESVAEDAGDRDRLAALGWRAPRIAAERLLAPKLDVAAARFVEVDNPFRQTSKMSGAVMIEIDSQGFDQSAFVALSGRWADRVGLGRDDGGARYAVRLSDTADWLALFAAIRDAGAGVLPIHPATPRAAALRLAERAGCDRFVFEDEPIVRLEPSTAPAGGVLLQMSSGTTGEPKCVARGWAEIDRELDAYVASFPDPDEMTAVVACPTTHSYGLICGTLAALRRGRAPKIVNAANPKSLLRILRETERPLLYASPAVLHTLAMLPPPGETIHAAMTSGTLLPGPWFERIRAKTGRLFQQYGCSEAGCVAINRDLVEPDVMGRPLPHLAVSAGASRESPAEIVIEGPRGPIRTSDLGFVDRDGALVFVARLDDTINVSGLNVYPGEVEDAVMAHPHVADAVAFRIADAFAGERVGLLVSGPDRLDQSGLRDWCRNNLASHQMPAEILQVDAIPRQANGKISRREVAAAHLARRGSASLEAAR